MVNGDIPVTGSAVRKGGRFTIAATNSNPPDDLKVRITPGKTLHIFVDTNTADPNSKKFNENVNNDNWLLRITEV